MQKRRILYLEALRIAAAFFVVVNHTNSSIFLNAPAGKTALASLSYFFLSKFAVPAFFMISGALLLNRTETFRDVLGKRVWKTLCALCAAFLAWYVCSLPNLSAFRLSDFLVLLMQCGHVGRNSSLWFLYAYLGILLMLPFLQRLAQALDKNSLRVLLIGWFLYGSCYQFYLNVMQGTPVTGYFQVPLFSGYMGYLFLGYYLHACVRMSGKRQAGLGAALIVGAEVWTVGFTYMIFLRTAQWNLVLDNIMMPSCVLSSVGVFLFVRGITERIRADGACGKCIYWLGQRTFGIYLVHTFVIQYTGGFYNILAGRLHPMLAMLLWEIVIFAISIVLTFAAQCMVHKRKVRN